MEKSIQLLTGDCRTVLQQLKNETVQTCITSPPFWCLRDYDEAGQLGTEPTLNEYVDNLVGVFREVKRVLKSNGTLWLNLGDCFASTQSSPNRNQGLVGLRGSGDGPSRAYTSKKRPKRKLPNGLKRKDLIGVPWRVAFALQSDGWWLRSDIVWSKPNPVPESVRDRPTRSHELVFLLSKASKYYYDADGASEPRIDGRGNKNRRTVWTIPTQRNRSTHFATFPESLVEPCVKAGSDKNDIVLDCFSGIGTTGVVASKLGRKFIGIEISAAFNAEAERALSAAKKSI